MADVSAVIGLVGQDVVGLEALQESRGLWRVAGLPWGEDDAQRPAKGVGGEMDLGRQTSS